MQFRNFALAVLVLSLALCYSCQSVDSIHRDVELFQLESFDPIVSQTLVEFKGYGFYYTSPPPTNPAQRVAVAPFFDANSGSDDIQGAISNCAFGGENPSPNIHAIVSSEDHIYYFGESFYELIDPEASDCTITPIAEGDEGANFNDIALSSAFFETGNDVVLFGEKANNIIVLNINDFKAATLANKKQMLEDGLVPGGDTNIDITVKSVLKVSLNDGALTGYILFADDGSIYRANLNPTGGANPLSLIIKIDGFDFQCTGFDNVRSNLFFSGSKQGPVEGAVDDQGNFFSYLVSFHMEDFGTVALTDLNVENLDEYANEADGPICKYLAGDWTGGQVLLSIYVESSYISWIQRHNALSLVLLDPPSTPLVSTPSGPVYFYSREGEVLSLADSSLRYALSLTRNMLNSYTIPSACPNDCGESLGHGTCVNAECQCETGFDGADCFTILCDPECDTYGECNFSNGQCVCDEYHTGENCLEPRCKNSCNGSNGVCRDIEGELTCECTALWAGDDCSLRSYENCDAYASEDDCTSKYGCGWCRSSNTCIRGNGNGPVEGACQQWHYGQAYQVGLLIVALIMIIIFVLMIINNVLSSISVDYRTAGVIEDNENLLTTSFLKEAYWRDERSSKSWALFEQYQFIAFYALLNVTFPTRLIQFTRYFNWSMFSLPLPFYTNENVYDYREPSRIVLNADQYANSLGLDREQIYYSVMFWFLIATIICLALYGIYALIAYLALRSKQEKIGRVLFQKVFYVLCRLVLAAQLPITIVSAYHIRGGHSDNPATIAAAVITLIIFGILPILFNGFVVRKQDKNLLYLYLKLRYGALYSVYHYKKARFGVFVLIKRFVFGCLLGFLIASVESQDSYIEAQVITLIIVNVIYIVLLFIFRPYLDSLHFIMDILLAIFNSVALGVAMMHKSSTNSTAEIIAATCVVLAFVVCLVAYIHSWVKIKGRATYICCMFKGEVDPSVNENEAEMKPQSSKKNPIESEEAEESSDLDSSILSDDEDQSEEETGKDEENESVEESDSVEGNESVEDSDSVEGNESVEGSSDEESD